MYIKLEQYKIFNEAATTLSFSIAARNLLFLNLQFPKQSAVLKKNYRLNYLFAILKVLV